MSDDVSACKWEAVHGSAKQVFSRWPLVRTPGWTNDEYRIYIEYCMRQKGYEANPDNQP